MKVFTKNVKRVAASKTLIVFVGLLTSVLIARVLGPEKNGEIAAILVYPSIFMSLGTLGIRQSTTYFVGKGIFKIEDVKSAVMRIWLFSSLFSSIISFILIYFVSNATNEYFLITLAVLPIPLSLFNNYNAGLYLGRNKIGSFNKINWIPPLVTLAITFILVYNLGYEIKGFLIAILFGNLSIFLILFIQNNFWKHLFLPVKREISKKLIHLGLMYAVSLFVITLNYRFDIILLDQLSTAEKTGIYSKGAGIAHYLWQIPMLFSTIIFAGSATSRNDELYSLKVFRLFRITFLFSVCIALLLSLFSKVLIVFLFGNEFSHSATILNILLPGVVILMFFKVLNMDLAGKGRPLISLKAMLPALILNIILNYALIPSYGGEGAAWASTLSYGLGGFLFLYFYSKAVNVSIKEIISPKSSDFKVLKDYLLNR